MKYHIRLDQDKPETERFFLNEKVNLRLSKHQKKELQRIAKEMKISVSELIRRTLNN